MKTIDIFSYAGKFAENKDVARDLREKQLIPFLKNEEVTIDFRNVDATTQSFIHALISDAIRNYGIGVLDRINFKNCNNKVQTIIEIVVDYMQAVPGITNKEDKKESAKN